MRLAGLREQLAVGLSPRAWHTISGFDSQEPAMPRTRSLRLVLVLAKAAFLAAAFYPAFAASHDQGSAMDAMSHGAMSMGGRKEGGQPAVDISGLGITGEQRITVYVPGGSGLGFTGPDKQHHDTVVPSSFVLRKGVPVVVTVINLDDMRHSITAPGLGVNIIIMPGSARKNGTITPSSTTYTFTPGKVGQFRWFCVFPCDMPQHWAMSADYDGPDRDGFMAGIIRVL
jgi:heme/copper-type cytochrome/quinol oxidase subunit 2